MAREPEPVFASLLQSYRLAAGLTQEDLAERAGLSVRGISDLERGLIRRPQERTTSRIADALGLAAYDRVVFVETARHGTAQASRASSPPRLPTGSYLGAVPIGPLIGRHREVGEISRAIAATVQGEARLLLLSGEPGIGKTRLAQETMLLLERCGFLVATGRCYEAESGTPFFPFVDALSHLYGEASDRIRSVIAERWPYVARLLPGEGLRTPQAAGDGQDQQRLFRAVSGFVQELARERPVAILLDDLHWADRGTLNLIKHVVRRSQTHRILVLGTHRALEAASPYALAESIIDLRHEGLVVDLAIPALDLGQTRELLRSLLGSAAGLDALAPALHERADGNPFYVQELLRALVERGDLEQREGRVAGAMASTLPMPETVRELVQQRLARLEAESRAVLVYASILGQSFRLDDLQLLCGMSEEAVEEALEDGRSAGLVRILGRDRYTFDHALTHGALYAGVPPSKRRRLHLAAGSTLEDLPASRREGRASEIARHFREGEDLGRALTWAVAAGDEAEAIFAHAQAERHYRAALDLLDPETDMQPERQTIRRRALIRLGGVLSTTAQYDEAAETFNLVVAQASAAGNLDDLARAVAGLAVVYRGRGSAREGTEIVAPWLEQVSGYEVSPASGAELFVALSHLYFTAGQYDALLWAAEHAVARALQTGSEWMLAAAEGRYGVALTFNNQPDDAQQMLESAVLHAEASGNLESLGSTLNSLASLAWNDGRLGDQLLYRQKCLAVIERLDDQRFLTSALSNLGGAYMLLGQWSEARAHHMRAIENLRTFGSFAWAPYPFAGLALLSCSEGNIEEAIHYAEKGLELAERSGDLQAISFLERDLAEANRLRGRPDLSRDRLLRLRARVGDMHATAPRILPALAEAYLALGENERAKDVIDLARARATEVKQYLVLIDISRIQGAVLGRLGQWSEAEIALRVAVDRARALSYPLGLARALDELGDMLSRKGEPQRASAFRDEAQSIYRRLGAAAYYRN